jgi:hypothetical protein
MLLASMVGPWVPGSRSVTDIVNQLFEKEHIVDLGKHQEHI